MAWDLLFSSDYGLFSVFVIVFIIGMAIWFPYFYNKKMREDEGQASK
ncbi:conserved hypothetical protein [Candidatus Accumulibacter aalborgensis]|uniref:DUF3149 domain-containing protein n=1 Tax=Candidatus Accumulibacter aalborgensis TaxID=1860102 RepID=A0A1A8XNQ0_9PROT|nr:DUF3149 domain-containing protein [Candidatus Accumulibacter aalborgensis]SBT06271.1 conserved hypothetical protein [Candidatus Accumulibacter aalborgensis]